jgi:hypothetical protein
MADALGAATLPTVKVGARIALEHHHDESYELLGVSMRFDAIGETQRPATRAAPAVARGRGKLPAGCSAARRI